MIYALIPVQGEFKLLLKSVNADDFALKIIQDYNRAKGAIKDKDLRKKFLMVDYLADKKAVKIQIENIELDELFPATENGETDES